MRLLTLSPSLTLTLDIVLWLLIHLGFSYGCYRIPITFFSTFNSWFHLFAFEKNNHFYERFFFIKSWKPLLPDGSALFKKGFRKRHLNEQTIAFLQTFILESRRAELTHWLCLVPAPFFFLWNEVPSGWVMIAYALLANLPCILVQRYNRIRLERVVARRILV